MSRIGNKEILIPAGVTIIQNGQTLEVTGPKGKMEYTFDENVAINIHDNKIKITRHGDEKYQRAIHGTSRALLHNMITGVTTGFSKSLEIQGTGFRAQLQGNALVLNLGFSHQVVMEIPKGLKVEVPNPTEITVSGYDKQAVGQFAAEIRKNRKPEPYKGKGVRYKGEYVRRKEGKKDK